jgi:hypothetical protein
MRVGQHNTFLPIRGSVHYDLLWLPELCAGAENEPLPWSMSVGAG